MKILFLSGREVSYPANQVILDSFRQYYDVDVISEMGSGKSIIKRSVKVLLLALSSLISKKYDLIFVGFFGHFIMPLIRPFTRVPILFYPFISTFETLIYDRKKALPGSFMAKASYALDYAAFHAANHILLDTQANVDCFSKMFKVPRDRFSVVFLGSDERVFYPRLPKNEQRQHIILYHGSFLPLQGIDVVIEAARRFCGNETILFRLLGGGLEYNRIHRLVEDLGLKNVEFRPAVPLNQLPEQIAEASLCLGGHFGTSDKAARVIAGKTFQDIAMGKATLVGDNAANHELLTHGYDAWFCPMNDAGALADGILTLVNDPGMRQSIGNQAHQTFLSRASLKVISPQVQQVVERVISS